MTTKQAMFALTYCQTYQDTGELDPVFAARAAYQCRDDEGFRTLGYEILAKPPNHFRANRFFDAKSALRTEVEKAMISGRFSSARLRAMRKIVEGKGEKKIMRSQKWNRSSCLSPEQSGAVNSAVAAEMGDVMPRIINLGLPEEKVSGATKRNCGRS